MQLLYDPHTGKYTARNQTSRNALLDYDYHYSPQDLHRLATDHARAQADNMSWARSAANAARDNPVLAALGLGGIALVAAPALAVAPAIAAANCVGFGAGGIVASSFAAATQAAIGNVAAGSAFAWATSLGAGGYATAAVASFAQMAGAGAAAAAAGAAAGRHGTRRRAEGST
ncbi:Interferon-induced 6-16 family [Microdochium nivale]|nr:Interferon-induced 6-16 family [Microdochium nivale]